MSQCSQCCQASITIIADYAPNVLTTDGDLLTVSSNTYTRLPIGSEGEVLTVSGGLPSWEPGGGGGSESLTDTYANRPVSADTGQLFFPSDGFAVDRYSGTVWAPWGPLCPFTPPVNGDFSWVNQGTATVTESRGGIYLEDPATNGGQRIRVKTAPTPPYTITIGSAEIFNPVNNNFAGFLFRESSTGRIECLGWDAATGGGITGVRYTAPGAFDSVLVNVDGGLSFPTIRWMRFADDNTSRIWYLSTDGVNFVPIFTTPRTTFLTADQVGIFVWAIQTSTPCGMTLYSWAEA